MKKSKDKKTVSKTKKILNTITTIISTVFFVILLVCMISVIIPKFKGQEPNLFGYRFMYILTDSMEPDLPVGSSILVKNTTADKVKLGDYVVYMTDDELYESTGVRYITHKCIETVHADSSGNQVITTQGIKVVNGVQPPVDDPVEVERVQAVFVGKVPSALNKLFSFLLTSYGLAALICIPIIVALALQLVGQIKQVVKKVEDKTDDELVKEEVDKQTALITKDVQDYFIKEQEKIKAFLAKSNQPSNNELGQSPKPRSDNSEGND